MSQRRRRQFLALVQVARPRLGWRAHIGAILETWIDLQHRFYESVGHVAYCYNERANVGLLAAAAWHCNHLAIEEFTTRKGNGWRGPGRVDLFVQIGRCDLCIEAKTIQLRAPQTEVEWRMFWRVLGTQLRAARHEAARASRGTFRHRVGLLFCVLSRMTSVRSSSKWAREFKRSLDSRAPPRTVDFLAAYLPASGLPAGLQRCPGVILAGSATRAARSFSQPRHRAPVA